jgi:hypothetical protein
MQGMIKIPKKIRNEIENRILEFLKSKGMLITHPSFNYSFGMIKLRYLIKNKAGNQFSRRIPFKIKSKLSLDSFPKKDQGFFDEVIKIHVTLDKGRRFTSSAYPSKKPNFKLPKSVKRGINHIILGYLRNGHKTADYVVNSPVFKYERNKVQVRFFDDKFREEKVMFKFLKSNQKVSKPTPDLERIIRVHTGYRGFINTIFAYHKSSGKSPIPISMFLK